MRYNFVQQQLAELAQGPGGQFLAKLGINILLKSNNIDIFARTLPQMRAGGFANGKDTITTAANVSWQVRKGTPAMVFRAPGSRMRSR